MNILLFIVFNMLLYIWFKKVFVWNSMISLGFVSAVPLLFMKNSIPYYLSILALLGLSIAWVIIVDTLSNWFVLVPCLVLFVSTLNASKTVVSDYRKSLIDFIEDAKDEEEKVMWLEMLKLSDVKLWNRLNERSKY